VEGRKHFILTSEARVYASSGTSESMTEGIVSGDVVRAVNDLYWNIKTFTVLFGRYYIW
jgi:hypothetical protein